MDWKNRPHQIFNKIKNQMFAKGVENFIWAQQCAAECDPNSTALLTPHQFNLFTNKIGVFLTTQEIRNIRDIYAKGENICYRDLLEDVKYSIPEKITALISQAFDKLDPECTGCAPLEVLCNNYCASSHPHVLSRRKAPEEVFAIFQAGMSKKAEN